MPLPVEPDAIRLLPEGLARRYQVCPLRVQDGYLLLASAGPCGPRVQAELSLAVGRPVRLVSMPPHAFRETLDVHYSADLTWKATGPGGAANTTAVVDEMLARAVRIGATDIHVEPQATALVIRYRVDGVLYPAPPLPIALAVPVVARIKVLAGLDIVDRERPQEGALRTPGGTQVRVSTIGCVRGEKAALRLLGGTGVERLEDLGLRAAQLELWSQAARAPQGLLLVSGPTGSGKTTTLYATVRALDPTVNNVITLEDPVEARLDGVTQVPVSGRCRTTFAEGLRALLRHDPDVMVVGEIRDPETARVAVEAALTGHLVLATVHARSAVATVCRLRELGVPPDLLSAALSCVVSQRLVRRVCSRCSKGAELAPSERAYWEAILGRSGSGQHFRIGRGCPSCHYSGYLGRTVIAEALALSDSLRRLTVAGATEAVLATRAREEGFMPMATAGCLAAAGGVTTVAEVMRRVG